MKVSKNHDYAAIRAQARAEVDRLAAIERRKYITTDPGQDYVYAEKLREAWAFLATDYSDTADFPFLQGESIATSTSAKAVAQGIIAASRVNNVRLARVETTRITAKRAIDEAPDKVSVIQAIPAEISFLTGGF